MRDFQSPGRSAVFATQGMCATSHPLAAQVAVDVLKQGGNAMDAAIAAAVMLPLCEPHMTGLGGDCFVLIDRPGGGEVIALNGSGRAPAGADPESLRQAGRTKMLLDDAHAVTIPGAIDAFCRLSADHGKLGLADSLAPAIHYADAGVPVAPRVASDWVKIQGSLQGPARQHYLHNGAPPAIGDLFRAPGQAEVLRRVAQSGRDAFYQGEIAEDILSALHAHGGVHSAEDLASTSCTYTSPLSGTYGDLELIEHPPNGQGVIAILILNILSHFDISDMDPFGPLRTHIAAEASKLAYDARDRFVRDPDAGDLGAYLADPATAAKLAALINPGRVIADVRTTTEAVHKDTVYLTVVDRDHMAVSFIFSIFHGFGSGIASPKFGLLLQNRGAGFSLEPGHPNEYGPGKRPMHTIIPGMLRKNGQVHMPFGVMGGQYQPAGHAHVISNMVDFAMDPQSAIDAPRAFAEAGKLTLETGYSSDTIQALSDIGHDVVVSDAPIGGAQAIRILDNGVLEGASDPRKDGCAIGY